MCFYGQGQVFLTWTKKFDTDLDHSLGHHADGILEGLPFVAEPDTDHFSFVTQLMRHSCDLGA